MSLLSAVTTPADVRRLSYEELDQLAAEIRKIDRRVAKPLDLAMSADAGRHRLVVTVEDGIRSGGVGSHIREGIAALGDSRHTPPVLVLGLPSSFIDHGKPDRILADLALDAIGVAAATTRVLPSPDRLTPGPAQVSAG